MNKNMLEICTSVVEKALKLGADGCKARFSKHRSVEIKYRERRPEIVKEATTQNLVVNLFIGGKYSSQNTPDIRKNALDDFLNKAVENTKFVEEDPGRSLPGPEYYKEKVEIDLQLHDVKYKSFTTEQRHQVAKTIEEVCLAKGGDKVISVESGSSDTEWEEVIVGSNGFAGSVQATDFWGGASMTIRDNGDRKPSGYYWAGCRNLDDMPSLEEIGERAANKTLDLLGGEKIATQTLPVIIENRIVSNLLSGFMSGLYGGNIQQKRSFLADKKGKDIGSKLFTLIEDPFIQRGFGSRLYDGDGFPAKKKFVLNEGRIEDFFIDWYYSRKLNCEPTSGNFSNLVLPPGTKSPAELMKDIGRGILITGFIGGNSNTTTGDFSIGVIGKLFENGVPVKSIAEMNMAGNHLDFWKKLVAVGNDPWKYSSMIMPSIVIDNVVIAGQ